MPQNKFTLALGTITESMVQANVAIPIIFGTIGAIVALVQSVTGEEGLTLSERADLLESKLTQNDTQISAEVARLRGMIGE